MTQKYVQTPAVALYAPVSAVATSMRVTPYPRDLDGNKLTFADFGASPDCTVDPKVFGVEEIMGFTGITDNGDDTASITGLVRNLISKSPYTTAGTGRQHGSSAVVVFSNNPGMYGRLASKENDNIFTGANQFDTPPLTSQDPLEANSLTRASYVQAYVAAVVLGTLTTINLILPGKAGETITAGNLVYFDDPTNRWLKCDADTASTVENVLLAIAQGAGTAGNAITGGVLLQGVDTHQSGLTEGDTYYASNTAGGISNTPGTTEVTIGIGKAATELYFSPRFNQVLTEDQQDALAGASGNPSSLNLYETQEDASNGIDQSQLTQNGSSTVGEADATTKHAKLAQSFVAGKTSITGALLNKQADTGSFTGTVTVSLQANSAGSPSGVALATITLNNATWLATPAGSFGAIFGTPYTAVAGTTYWLVVETSTTDNSNHPNIGTNTTGGYGSGSVKFQNTTDGWTAISTIDLYFQTLTTIVSKLLRRDSSGLIPGQYATDVGSTDAYYIAIPGITSYILHQTFRLKVNTANTGAATINVNGLGAKTIVKYVNTTLADGDIAAGMFITIIYDGTNFVLQNPIATQLTYGNGSTIKDVADASTTQNIAHGLGRIPKKITITFLGAVRNTEAPAGEAVAAYNGTTSSVVGYQVVNAAARDMNSSGNIRLYGNLSGNETEFQTGVITFDATNIIITWTKTNSPTGTFGILWEAEG